MTDPQPSPAPSPPRQDQRDPWSPPEGDRAPSPPAPRSPEEVKAKTRAAAWLAAGAALSALLLVPVGGLVLGVGAAVVGLRARAWARANAVATSTATTAVAIGVVTAALAAGAVAVQVVYYEEIDAYQECKSAANTQITADQCRDAYEAAVPEWVEGLR